MIKMADMARQLAALFGGREFTVYTEAPKRVDGEPFVYLRLRDARDGADTPGLCTRDIKVEVLCAEGDGISDAFYYAFYDLCTALFLPYVEVCGRCVVPKDIMSTSADGMCSYSFRLVFEDDVESARIADDSAHMMGELNIKEDM